MRIDGVNNVNSVYKANKAQKAYGTSSVTSSKDQFAISSFAKELQGAQKVVNNAPDVRMSVVDDLKQRMEAGKYNVAASQIADKLLG